MSLIDTLLEQNERYAASGFVSGLSMLPSKKIMIIGCVDPRVDPMDVLQLKPGDAAMIRNVGGRVNPSLFETMGLLRVVSKAAGQEVGEGWNLIVMQHTDCGISHAHRHAPEMLAKHMGVPVDELEGLAISDPFKAVAIDVAKIKANPNLPAKFTVSGLVYDVADGRITTVVSPAPLRE